MQIKLEAITLIRMDKIQTFEKQLFGKIHSNKDSLIVGGHVIYFMYFGNNL